MQDSEDTAIRRELSDDTDKNTLFMAFASRLNMVRSS